MPNQFSLIPLLGLPGGSEWIILICILIPLYFIPSFIARKSNNLNKIFLLNLLGGWTAIGWIAALIWAIMSIGKKDEILIVDNTANANRQQEKVKQLQQLKELLDSGVLTKGEFGREKGEVLTSG